MTVIRHILYALTIGAVATSLLACDSIYDDPFDFSVVPSSEQSFNIVDCTDYLQWTYFNLHDKETVTLPLHDENVPISWDIAIHRYDVKTNNGAAIETNYASLDDLQKDLANKSFTLPQDDEWQEDAIGKIYVDMSQMTEGILITEPMLINHVITRWLDVDLRTMPPIYTPSNKVYLLRLNDNTYAAIRFTGYSNPQLFNAKGYISFDYIYPLSIPQE